MKNSLSSLFLLAFASTSFLQAQSIKLEGTSAGTVTSISDNILITATVGQVSIDTRKNARTTLYDGLYGYKAPEKQIVTALATDKVEQAEISLSPNPATVTTSVQVHSKTSQTGTYTIKDLNGNTVKNNSMYLTHGFNTIELTISDLTNGVYYLELLNDGVKTVKKLIKN